MSIVERVLRLNLPLDKVVVIGSGVLDALDLRSAGDVDLVLDPSLFEELSRREGWISGVKHQEPYLTMGDVEVFLSWGSNSNPNFVDLYKQGIIIEGICFANPLYVINWKRRRGSEKDKSDIDLLEEHLLHG